jgi:orotidine-5'-phosphate decarboxylase
VNFREKLIRAARKNQSWLCVGLDPELSRIPDHFIKEADSILEFNRAVIDTTKDLVCAYKPNSAFYEAHGEKCWELLRETIKYIPSNIPIILDCKRGDIGNTAKMYARAAFDILGADAVTVNPYMGKDSVEPFLAYRDKGVFILCLTSNPSASELQKKLLLLEEPPSAAGMTPQAKAQSFAEFFGASTIQLYQYIARLATEWDTSNNAGLVVGATSVYELEMVRKNVGDDFPILIPGVGAQGGDLEQAVESGSNSQGELAIINIARGIIYAGKGIDYRDKIRQAAETFRKRIGVAISKKTGAIS